MSPAGKSLGGLFVTYLGQRHLSSLFGCGRQAALCRLASELALQGIMGCGIDLTRWTRETDEQILRIPTGVSENHSLRVHAQVGVGLQHGLGVTIQVEHV